MNIIVDETPVIPYEVYRRYIAGSAEAHVILSGDVIGPIFPGGEPVDFMSMFAGSNHGKVMITTNSMYCLTNVLCELIKAIQLHLLHFMQH